MTLLERHKLYDRVIQFQVARKDSEGKPEDAWKMTTIGSLTGGGLKPAIEVSVTMLPNSVCLAMTVKLTNAILLQGTDISDYSVMSVKMGYADGNTISFTGPVFSSYIEKPNPDGVMVFEGIVCGDSGRNIFSPRPYHLKFYEKTNLKGFVDKICEGISEALPPNRSLTPDYTYCSEYLLYEEMDFQQGEYSAQNGYAVINWMQDIIYRWGKLQKFIDPDGFTTVQMQPSDRVLQAVLKGNRLYIVDSMCYPDAGERRSVVDVSACKSASFSGPALTMTAPYNPKVVPGSIIYFNPVYFKGGAALPNILDSRSYNPDEGLYRVIKMDIQFATFGSTNNMSILAIPVSMYGGNTSQQDEQLRTIQQAIKATRGDPDKIQKAIEKDQASVTTVITWGAKKETEVVTTPSGEEVKKPKDMWSVNYNPTNVSKDRIGVDAETGEGLEGILCLSQLALKKWGTDLFYLSDSELNEPFVRNSPKGVEMMYFFPLIMVATYKAMNSPGGKGVYWIDPNNPDMVQANYYVSTPALTKDNIRELIGNQEVATIFKDVQRYYDGMQLSAWAGKFQDIYNYITKGKK